jgi:hypothetical protein
MATAIARRERTADVPGTPTSGKGLTRELQVLARRLDVENRLRGYGAALQTTQDPELKDARYFLLTLDPMARALTIDGYEARQLGEANAQYLKVERELDQRRGAEAVLVSVESLALLRRAYPNYFLDTDVFLKEVERAVKRNL